MLKGSSLPTPLEETDISLEKLEQKLIQIHDENTEIIQRISAKVNSGVEISTFEYIIEPEKTAQSKRQPHKFTVREVQHKQSVKAIVDVWTVSKEEDGLPQAPDPDELLYGKDKDFMDCSCVKFVDLVRINGQIEVAKKYTSLLRESLSIKFGRKFLHNFQAVNRLLHVVEALLSESSPSSLAEKRDAVRSLNEAAAAIFHQWENVSSVPDYISFANGSKEVTVTKATLHTVNKGTLLESGSGVVHTWKVRCDCKGQNEIPYDLGLLSPTYNNNNYINTDSMAKNRTSQSLISWGIRCRNGRSCFSIMNGREQAPHNEDGDEEEEEEEDLEGGDKNVKFVEGDVLTFTLHTDSSSAQTHSSYLDISINDRHKISFHGISLPLYVAFAGGIDAKATIISQF